MWWCCGKTAKDALGCKVAKHFSEEDKDEDNEKQEEDTEEIKRQRKMNIRCHCCKEKGHEADNCPRDPNLRTS